MPKTGNPNLDNAFRLGGIEDAPAVEDVAPSYRVMADSKIPVAKSYGILWEGRIKAAATARADIAACWSEAIRYYENDQSDHRNGRNGASSNKRFTRNNSSKWSETENVVFSNASTQLPTLYAKNPVVECTSKIGEAGESRARAIEAVINQLFRLKEAPGIGIKSKARRGVLMALLANTSYLRIGWTDRQDSNEQAIADLTALTRELETVKTKKEILEVEGKIRAIEERFSVLNPAGPSCKLVSPFRIFVDPTAMEPDHSDANWMAEEDYLPTDYINAVYAKESSEGSGEKYTSLYEPSHVLKAGDNQNSIEDEINNFTLLGKTQDNMEPGKYGYNNSTAFNSALYTKVWWIWDKTTRRLFLYADNNWKWPLWVWDDPLKLLRFFPYHRLWFHETPDGSQPKGEVTYYLDQQDAINDINSEIHRARQWAKNNVYFDKNSGLTADDVQQILKGDDGTARGVDVPEGKSLKDVIASFVPPSMQHPELWSTDQRFAQINRITGVNEAQRGGQFKTNTTNKAVEEYSKTSDIRTDEKIDAIEDWLGDFAYSLAQLVCRNFTSQQVKDLVGESHAGAWQQIADPQTFRTQFGIEIIGGSTDKPTSSSKKKQAMEAGQVLGQFAGSIPAVGIVMLKMFERAFDDVIITDEDWQMIFKTMNDQQNKAGAGPGGGDPAAQGGAPQDPNAPSSADPRGQLKQLIEGMSPEDKTHLQQLVQSGVPPSEALKQVMEQQHAQVAAQPPQPGVPPQQH